MASNHAAFDPSTKSFTSDHYEQLRIPDDLTIDQFLFSYSPIQAIQSIHSLQGHLRPKPNGRTWLIDSVTGREYSFEDCQQRTESLAQAFYHHLGLRPGQVVVIYAPNDIDYPISIWATLRCGAIISGANPSFSIQELVQQLSVLAEHLTIAGLICHPEGFQTACKAATFVGLPRDKILLMSSLLDSKTPVGFPKEVFTLRGIIEKFKDARVELKPTQKLNPGEAREKIAFLCFSSGTTGLPKAVCIPHFCVIANMIQILKHHDQDVSGEKTLAVLPYYHIFGLVVVLHSGLYRNLTNVVVPKFILENFLHCLTCFRPSILCLVPPIIVLLTKHPTVDLKKEAINRAVKQVFSGAAPLTEALIVAFKKRFPNVELAQLYGMTETSAMVIGAPPPTRKPCPAASVGVLCPNVRMKIISDQGKFLGFGQRGEILIQSPSNPAKYLGNPTATMQTFSENGYVRTGDEGYIDHQGWVYVVERLKDIIKVKGNQVAPAELEGHLLGHPSIADVCVVGIPDDFAGELPRAFVVRTAEAKREDPIKLSYQIKKFVCDHQVPYKWLEGGVQFVDSIPKSSSGKILRRKVKATHVTQQETKSKI